MSCLFCEIAEGRVPSAKVHEDPEIVAFRDINPQAPNHVLVIPRKHLASPLDVTEADDALLGRLVRRAVALAKTLGFADRGFRLVFNSGDDAGYSVSHVHLHLLGGRKLGWPPG
jgi:histidine triad (HIT) family protein